MGDVMGEVGWLCPVIGKRVGTPNVGSCHSVTLTLCCMVCSKTQIDSECHGIIRMSHNES